MTTVNKKYQYFNGELNQTCKVVVNVSGGGGDDWMTFVFCEIPSVIPMNYN